MGRNPALHCRAIAVKEPSLQEGTSAGTFMPTWCHSTSGYSFPTYPAPVLAQESQKNSLCVQQHRYVRGYINLSLLTVLGWQQQRTGNKALHNQRPQEFVGKMCETPSVFRIVCFTANLAISKILVREEKRLHSQTKGEPFCYSSSCALPAPCLTTPH